MKHRVKKIRAGKYIYRGVEITRHGYYQPERRVVWEGGVLIDKVAHSGDYHGFSLAQVKALIDADLDKK